VIVTVSVNANETVPTNSGLLAQSVEHRAFNPQVERSSRSQPTMIKALWHTKEYDLPVEIIQYLGRKDGEHWYLIRTDDGQTGVPGSQLTLINESPKNNYFFS
jgi:hypothetical protein